MKKRTKYCRAICWWRHNCRRSNIFADARFWFLPKPSQILPKFSQILRKFPQIYPKLSKFCPNLPKKFLGYATAFPAFPAPTPLDEGADVETSRRWLVEEWRALDWWRSGACELVDAAGVKTMDCIVCKDGK